MAKIGQFFESRFLRAEDLGASHVRVVIETVQIEPLRGGKRPVLYFRGKKRGLVLNQTRARALAKVLASDETDDWLGCTITIYADGATVTDEQSGRRRQVQVIAVDERPDSAVRPKRAGEKDPPPGPPLTAEDIPRW